MFNVFVWSASCLWAGPLKYIGFDESWANPDVDFNAFTEAYIYKIDLRELKTKIWDEGEDDFIDFIDDDTLQEVAQILYQNLFRQLNGIIPVKDAQTIDQTQKALMINLKLSADIVLEDQGFLMDLITAGFQSEPNALSLECQVFDARSGEKVLSFVDEEEFFSNRQSQIFSTAEDMEALSDLFYSWAEKFADFLTKVKGQAISKSGELSLNAFAGLSYHAYQPESPSYTYP